MVQYGLIGYPLTHSFSPAFFKEKFRIEKIKDSRYDAFPLESLVQLSDLLFQKPDIRGLNVTIPYKETIIPYLDQIDPLASEIGAVNTILVKRGRLIGYNTDISGFESAVCPCLNSSITGALVLGTGGSSKAVVYALKKMGLTSIQISRKPGRNLLSYGDIDSKLLDSHKLVINCTPVGMFPQEHHCPAIPYDSLTKMNILFDLIYNPSDTQFLQKGKLRGALTINGLEMLKMQAEDSWKIWNREE